MGTVAANRQSYLLQDRVEGRLGRPAHNAEREVELRADVLGIVARERESHKRLRIDDRLRFTRRRVDFTESLIEFVGRLIEFGRYGLGNLNTEGDHVLRGLN